MLEAELSALILAALAGVGLTLMPADMLRDIGAAFAVGGAITLALGAVMAGFAGDGLKQRDEKSAKGG
jgi:hypothetical protein